MGASIRLASGTAEVVKWLAIVLMVLDHVDAILLDRSGHPVFWLGRLAFPLFAFLLAHNHIHWARSWKRQAGRLMALALVSQPIYMAVFDTARLNILFTLALGLLACRVVDRVGPDVERVLGGVLLLLLALGLSLFVEYGPAGVLLVVSCRAWVRRPGPARAAAAAAWAAAANMFTPVALAAAGFVAIVPLARGREVALVRAPGWLFYVFYPVHLVVIAACGVVL